MKRVFSTVPFVVYIVALVWVTFISGVPRCIVALAEPIGAANSFAAMFMIGLMIEIKTKGAELWTVFSTLAVRYAASAALALLFYFYTPFPLVTLGALPHLHRKMRRRHWHGGLRGLYLHRHKRDSDDRLHGGHGDLAAAHKSVAIHTVSRSMREAPA